MRTRGSTIERVKEQAVEKIRHRLTLDSEAMKALEKIFNCHDVSIPTNMRIIKAMVFPKYTMELKAGF